MKAALKLIMIFYALVAAASCSSYKWREYHAFTCGTACNIIYRSQTDLGDSIASHLQLIESSLSIFNPHSPVSAVNRGDDIIADSILRRIFEKSYTTSAMTGGAFDPTIGPLVELWGFGSNHSSCTPTDSQIDSALASVGITRCAITADGRISKKSDKTTFNFGAIGKGFAADEIAGMLQRNGATDCMVEIGGDLALHGSSPRGTPWILQVDAPVENNTGTHERLLKIELTDCGIATSGNYRNYRSDSHGNRYGHTISPVTGRPVISDVLSATVIAPDAATADGLATACMVLGSNRALDMAAHLDSIEIMLVTPADSTTSGMQWKILTSPGFTPTQQ